MRPSQPNAVMILASVPALSGHRHRDRTAQAACLLDRAARAAHDQPRRPPSIGETSLAATRRSSETTKTLRNRQAPRGASPGRRRSLRDLICPRAPCLQRILSMCFRLCALSSMSARLHRCPTTPARRAHPWEENPLVRKRNRLTSSHRRARPVVCKLGS